MLIFTRRAFTSEGKVPVELMEVHLKTKEWSASLKTKTRKKEVLREASSNGALKARLRKSSLDSCSSRKERQEIFFQLLRY